MSAAGKAKEAAKKFFSPDAKHHNAFFAAGMDALTDAMATAHKENPDKRLTVKQVLADGDLVAVHSHVVQKPGDPGGAVVHLFRFQGDKIIEFWDVGQQIPGDSPNTDGMF